MSNSSNYKRYQLSQLGIKESTIKPSDVDRDAFPGIDPKEWEKGAGEERDEHGMPIKQAVKTAADHLGEPDQKHYYSGMEKAKGQGMLRDMMSPTAIATPVIGMAVRGSSTGGFPSGIDQTGIPSNTPTGRLGGYEPIPTAKDNSEVIDKTPSNSMINSSNPISREGSPTEAEPHPHQIQQSDGAPPQDITGASTDSDDTLTITQSSSAPEETEKSVDIDVPDNGGNMEPNDMDGEESLEDEDKAKAGLSEGKHKKGCQCGFCKNKGSFGKKKTETDENAEPEKAPDDDKKKGKKLIVDKDKDDTEEKVEERYSPPFERMRGLANLGSRKLSSNGLWENSEPSKKKCMDCGKELPSDSKSSLCSKCTNNMYARDNKDYEDHVDRMSDRNDINEVGASEPFTTKWKMDKEKAGMVKVDECDPCGCGKPNTTHNKKVATKKLNEVHQSLIKKAQTGRMNAKETQIYQLLKEVLQKRNVRK